MPGRWARWWGPVTRTGRYYAQSWLGLSPTANPIELPIARPTYRARRARPAATKSSFSGLRARRPVSDVHEFDRINREVVAALEFYGIEVFRLLASAPTGTILNLVEGLEREVVRSCASHPFPLTAQSTTWALHLSRSRLWLSGTCAVTSRVRCPSQPSQMMDRVALHIARAEDGYSPSFGPVGRGVLDAAAQPEVPAQLATLMKAAPLGVLP